MTRCYVTQVKTRSRPPNSSYGCTCRLPVCHVLFCNNNAAAHTSAYKQPTRLPGSLGERIIRETPRWRSKTWDRTTCFAGAAAAERQITRTALEKDQGGRVTRSEEKKRREKKIETRVCVYGIISPSLLSAIVATQIINELLARGEGENMLLRLWEKKGEFFSSSSEIYIYVYILSQSIYRANKLYNKEKYTYFSRKRTC